MSCLPYLFPVPIYWVSGIQYKLTYNILQLFWELREFDKFLIALLPIRNEVRTLSFQGNASAPHTLP